MIRKKSRREMGRMFASLTRIVWTSQGADNGRVSRRERNNIL